MKADIAQRIMRFRDAWAPGLAARRGEGRQHAPNGSVPHYGVTWLDHNLPESWQEGEPFHVHVSVRNDGTRTWSAHGDNQVNLVLRVDRQIHSFATLPHDISPGTGVDIGFPITLPAGVGDWELIFNFVEKNVAFFDRRGVRSFRQSVGRIPGGGTAYEHARAVARQSNWGFYTPSQGIARGRDDRAYPVLIDKARGSRIWDAGGNQWIDWVMGYGSSLLGYGHPEVTAAVGEMLSSGAGVMSLPHMVEMEVTERLLEVIPCAELVLFGKNGSDCCTAAVRAARISTGRDLVLFSGYHGWQEPFAQAFEPALRFGDAPTAFRFGLNDLDAFCRLVKEHKGRIAAVMLEPGAQVEGVDGPVRDVDRSFLRHVAEITRDHGAVLIFDEVMTGFRTPQGSIQKASGVTPDLAVFGKALAAGMPLSALVGKGAILGPTMERLFYHPTYKSDAYAMAAAGAALKVYGSVDVAQHVRRVGQSLKKRINELSRELGIDGEVVGLPFRSVYRFNDKDQGLRTLKRTLLQQELAKAGVLTFRGFMLPSLGHAETEVEETVLAFRSALSTVNRVANDNSFTSALEIPLVS